MRIGVREPAIRVLLGRLLRAGFAVADPPPGRSHIVTGPTGTTVDELYVLIVT